MFLGKFKIKRPRLTFLDYDKDPDSLRKLLESFGQGSQFEMVMTFNTARGEIDSYEIDPQTKKVKVKLKWLCSKENQPKDSPWAEMKVFPDELHELSFRFVCFYHQRDTGKIKIWSKKKQIVCYFSKPDDPTNLKKNKEGVFVE